MYGILKVEIFKWDVPIAVEIDMLSLDLLLAGVTAVMDADLVVDDFVCLSTCFFVAATMPMARPRMCMYDTRSRHNGR